MTTPAPKALILEPAINDRGNFEGWRGIVIAVDEDGVMSIFDIAESPDAREVAALLTAHRGVTAVVNPETHEFEYPDALSVAEAAECYANWNNDYPLWPDAR